MINDDKNINDTDLETEAKRKKKMMICKIAAWTCFLLIFVLRYLIGLMLLDSFFMTLLFTIIIFEILMFGEGYYDNLIKRSVIERNSAKRLLFYWIFIMVLLQCFAIVMYKTLEIFIPVTWIDNYVYNLIIFYIYN